jgi:nucleotide-binding universal stress UspA family protein
VVRNVYSNILVALDGSESSARAGTVALKLARYSGSVVVGCHVYGAELHNARFRDMEPSLSSRYRETPVLDELRKTHTGLIQEGLESLSQGYMDRFAEEACGLGVDASLLSVEGRNYVKILEHARSCRADLLVLGAHGLGEYKDGRLGSTVSRVLRMAACDVLICREDLGRGNSILVGLDGSGEALAALERATGWCRAFEASLEPAAAYDPIFHTEVFKVMSRSLSDARKEQIGLDRQEKLHHMIIDDGLKRLYEGFLEEGAALARKLGVPNTCTLLQGKASSALTKHVASRRDIALTVMGRFGHHREPCSDIGSNSEAVAQLARSNVLITKSTDAQPMERHWAPPSLDWEPEAKARLDRVPSFVRDMARRMVEERARERGEVRVSGDLFLETADLLGMGDGFNRSES